MAIDAFALQQLPSGCRWESIDDMQVVMYYDDKEVLRISPQRQGWVVFLNDGDPDSPEPAAAAVSFMRAAGWAARWANQHVSRITGSRPSPQESSAGPGVRRKPIRAGHSGSDWPTAGTDTSPQHPPRVSTAH